MFTEEEKAYLARAATTMQIIVGALALGVVSFMIVVVVICSRVQAPQPDRPLLTYMSVVAALVAVVVSRVFPGILIRNQRQMLLSGGPGATAGVSGAPLPSETIERLRPLVAGYQTVLIIRSAILEGAAFFCLTTYLLEHQSLSLVVTGILLFFLLGGFPTRSKVEEAIANERTTIDQFRQMGQFDAR